MTRSSLSYNFSCVRSFTVSLLLCIRFHAKTEIKDPSARCFLEAAEISTFNQKRVFQTRMGAIMSKKFKKTPQVLLMGLDSAGKSTLLYRQQRGVVMDTSPTVGFNVATVELDKKTSLTVWDIGGQGTMRANWRYYLEGCKVLVFVVDSSDRARLGEAKKALKKILSDEHLKGVPLMVLANKKDLPNSMTIREVSTLLELDNYTDRVWEIQACSATKGLGLQQAFLSIAKLLHKA